MLNLITCIFAKYTAIVKYACSSTGLWHENERNKIYTTTHVLLAVALLHKFRISRHAIKAILIFILCPGLGPQVGGHLELGTSTRVHRLIPCVWAAPTAITEDTAFCHHYNPAPASRLFWLPPTFLCCLCTGYLEQYARFHPWFWHLGNFQNCSENTPLQLRLHVMPLTAISRRLRFTPSWLTNKEISVIDWLIANIQCSPCHCQTMQFSTFHAYKLWVLVSHRSLHDAVIHTYIHTNKFI